MAKKLFLVMAGVCLSVLTWAFGTAQAKIDLATLTQRQEVQTTIYKKADLTLVRDQRLMTFAKGINDLQFSWANTRIDPTSLWLDFGKADNPVKIVEISFPAGSKDLGVWKIQADKACQVPVNITYFTSGLSWKSNYTLILARDLKTCSFVNHVDITNQSGEDYENAHTRLVVGKVNLLDSIRELSSRQFPYGRPEMFGSDSEKKGAYDKAVRMLEAAPAARMMKSDVIAPKQIRKESLSEYFLYTIEGRETIPDGWTKRLKSFGAEHVPVKNIYRYDDRRYGDRVVRFVGLKNDKDDHLGTTPLPNGNVTVFQSAGDNGRLDYIGSDRTKYIPIGQEAEFNLGSSLNVKITPKVMQYEKKNIIFDAHGVVNGFDDVKQVKITFSNYTGTNADAEYIRHLDTPDFKTDHVSHPKAMTKQDQTTLVFKLQMPPHSTQDITFTLTEMRGDRRWQK